MNILLVGGSCSLINSMILKLRKEGHRIFLLTGDKYRHNKYERVFEKYHPQIIINAAAHKHVPLMEHNCVEAIYNNVFGTQNLVELCEEYGAERFMMVSTDKAVNPTNVMGATKRMCEMIVQSVSEMYLAVPDQLFRYSNVRLLMADRLQLQTSELSDTL